MKTKQEELEVAIEMRRGVRAALENAIANHNAASIVRLACKSSQLRATIENLKLKVKTV